MRYEEWFPDVRGLVVTLAEFLNVSLNESKIDQIADESHYDRNAFIANGQRDWSNYDPETHIHGRHLNGGGSDKWRDQFDATTIERAHQQLEPFMRTFGYTL